MKRLFSPASLCIGTFLHLLGGALVIVGVFFFPAFITGWWNGYVYIYHPYSEWVAINNSSDANEPLLSWLLGAVFVALPLLSLCFVLGTSTAGLFREVSSRIDIWRRRSARVGLIVALVGLITHCLLGLLMETLGGINARQELGVGFGLVLLGFSVMMVSTFLMSSLFAPGKGKQY